MINFTAIENALYTWAYGVTSIQTIFAHQSGIFNRPSGQYILLNIISAVPRGMEEIQSSVLLPDNTVDISYSNVYELLVSVNTYKANAFTLATILKDSLRRVTVHEPLYLAGIGYNRTSGIQDIPEELDKDWEQRAQFDVIFTVRSLDVENIETIKQIELTNLIDGTTTTIVDPNFTP